MDSIHRCLYLDGIKIPVGIATTTRVVLRFIARIFDPLGFMTPFVMIAKFMFQELWQQGVGWDDEVGEELHQCFLQWVQGISQLRELCIPRKYSTLPWREINGLEVHAFGDASEKGYGAVIYLKTPRQMVPLLPLLSCQRQRWRLCREWPYLD